MKKKELKLSWEDFKSLGNPENAPEEPKEKVYYDLSMPIRIHIEKKGRGGKEVSIVRGLKIKSEDLKDYAKEMKTHCGVGGSVKNGEIIIQGNHRDKLISLLRKKGFTDIKKSGG